MSRLLIAFKFVRRAGGLLRSALLVAAALAATALAQPVNDSKQPDLSGTWRLNQKLSADLRNAPPAEFGNTERIVPVSSYEDWASTVKEAQRTEIIARVRELFEATKTLEIFQRGRELTMNATGSAFVVLTRTISTDGRPSEQGFGLGVKGESEARWNERKFIVETKTERGQRLTETYELSPSGDRLYVFVKIENERWAKPLFVRRIYDRQTAPQD